jgi:hypothetical protein
MTGVTEANCSLAHSRRRAPTVICSFGLDTDAALLGAR